VVCATVCEMPASADADAAPSACACPPPAPTSSSIAASARALAGRHLVARAVDASRSVTSEPRGEQVGAAH